jgi:uncharacterized DUF497 family protein
MSPLVAGFEWDAGNYEKCVRHGVSLEEIEAMFRRPIAIYPARLAAEERFIGVGQNDEGRNVLVVFTLRRHGEVRLIRPISARYMHRQEVEHYAKAKKAAGIEE